MWNNVPGVSLVQSSLYYPTMLTLMTYTPVAWSPELFFLSTIAINVNRCLRRI